MFDWAVGGIYIGLNIGIELLMIKRSRYVKFIFLLSAAILSLIYLFLNQKLQYVFLLLATTIGVLSCSLLEERFALSEQKRLSELGAEEVLSYYRNMSNWKRIQRNFTLIFGFKGLLYVMFMVAIMLK
jgi:UDP-N-acetylmuramyl pentapeptide phosphotransferase/UDP-N-acetylglucosamine-1-phosphate transferase